MKNVQESTLDPNADTQYAGPVPVAHDVKTWKTWYWSLIPVLAIIAYATVLRIGFLGDDSVLLLQAKDLDWDIQALLPRQGWFFYRPLGTLLTWKLGSQLWGYDPFPYHLQGLLLHAGVSLILGLWLSEVTSSRSLGWLAGVLFAVFPLHLEAVGWLAAQWDLWAAFFGLIALLLFTIWCRKQETQFYLLSLICYTLAVFSKESIFAFLPVLALSAWLVLRGAKVGIWRRIAFALIPFVFVLGVNLALRFSAWGSVGGYKSDQGGRFYSVWDGLVAYVRLLVAPLNATIVGDAAVQITGVLTSGLLLLGLVWFGHEHRRLVFVGFAWIIFALIPALNLPVGGRDLQNNRFLYIAAAGYCVVVAIVLHSVIYSTGQHKFVTLLIGLLVFLSIGLCWLQLRPWHTATVQAKELEQELYSLIPPQPRPKGIVWYVDNEPDNYQGAYLFRLGIAELRFIMYGEGGAVEQVQDVSQADLTSDHRDTFALKFYYDRDTSRFHVDYAAGITWDSPPPNNDNANSNLVVWDFRDCAANAVTKWNIQGAKSTCEIGSGLILQQISSDAQLIGPDLKLEPNKRSARFVRLRAAVSYLTPPPSGLVNQWFWKEASKGWDELNSKSMGSKQDTNPHVYWTYLAASDMGDEVTRLRFDPANGAVPAQIRWLAVDLVE